MIPKPGDILLFEKTPHFSFKDFYPFAIRLITGNKIVHVGFVFAVNESFCSYLDTNPAGPKLRILDYKTKISSTQLMGVSIARTWYNFQPQEIQPVVLKYIGTTKYSFRSIFNLALNHLVGVFKWRQHRAKVYVASKPNTFNCASLCAQILLDVNPTLYRHTFGDTPPCLLEPDDFTKRPFIVEPLL